MLLVSVHHGGVAVDGVWGGDTVRAVFVVAGSSQARLHPSGSAGKDPGDLARLKCVRATWLQGRRAPHAVDAPAAPGVWRYLAYSQRLFFWALPLSGSACQQCIFYCFGDSPWSMHIAFHEII